MSILSGPTIDQHIRSGEIIIDPYEPKNINPASIDLRLGNGAAVYSKWTHLVQEHECAPLHLYPNSENILDVREKPEVEAFELSDAGFVLKPGILYLMHTLERVSTKQFVPVLDGKSSIGRLGITIHLTAGFGDPGYDGQYTLEVTAMHPVRVYPGMRFCQMRFHLLEGRPVSYQQTGQYNGALAKGAVPSYAHTQFDNEQRT